MNKLFHGIVEIIFWIAIFSSPLLIGVAISFIIYLNASPALEWLSIVVVSLGILIGIFFAEKIRRKYGCTRFMSGLLSTPDIRPTDKHEQGNEIDSASKK